MTPFAAGVRAVAVKEVLHILRDRLTLALLITVPLVQLVLFGYAIDLHPHHMPTALVAHEDDAFTQRAVAALQSTGYFSVTARTDDAPLAGRWLAESRVQFVLELPPRFALLALTGEDPQVRLIADASDPVASLVATQAAQANLGGASAAHSPPLLVEQRYNPQASSRHFIVPGLLGVVLTLTLVLLGAFSFVRERERGTHESLAVLPVPRAAILLGKLAPYVLLGMGLFAGLLVLCTALLDLPWRGGSWALWAGALVFVGANLALGTALSLLTRSQMQAMQLGVFFYLPSMLLSGFMFPFHGMPAWARAIGETLPLTHFLRLVRGVLLKELPDAQALALAWPIVLFTLLAAAAAARLMRRGITS